MATVTVRLYGRLKQFGDKFELDVKDTAEIIRALCARYSSFKTQFNQGFFKVRIGRNYIDSRIVGQGLYYQLKESMTVHFTPVIKGAKRAGVFQLIAGAVLIGASFFIPGAGLWGGVITKAGVFGMGTAMLLGGVAQLLTKVPPMNTGNDVEKKSSTSFSGLGNMLAQGRSVPLAYGLFRCGSLIISQGVETYDVEKS